MVTKEGYHMDFVIREHNLSDYMGIWTLNKEEMGYEYPIEDTQANLMRIASNSTDRIYVAVSGDEVIGYIHACDYDLIYAHHMKNIMGIAVSKAWKHKGIGRALLSAVEQWAKETGAKGIRLVSGASRTGAHMFYRRCGYEGDKMQLKLKKEL